MDAREQVEKAREQAGAPVAKVMAHEATAAQADVRVWEGPSTALQIDPGCVRGPRWRADVIVSEVLDTGLIGEGCLHSMRDATKRLLAPGGVMIPASATLYVMLLQVSAPEHAGVSLQALEALREGYSAARLHGLSHVKLSVGVVAMRFEFAALPEQCGGEARIKVEASRRGACNAVGWWFDLHLDGETTLSMAPGATARTWKQNLHYLPSSLEVERGAEVEVLVWNKDDDNLHVLAGAPGTLPSFANFR
uniref:Protein arginine N-methyltransferase domain-containing protein n=1 Tax=Haptolina ericina TaxID=156174 RepID=A0A7S3EZ91_9EUKA